MIQIGRGIRWYNDYAKEVEFSKMHEFDFMQIWFKNGEILVNNIPEPKEKFIKDFGYPVIIHAVFDPSDFDLYGDKLLEIVQFLEHKDVIVHPVCEKEPLCENTDKLLAEKTKIFSQKARSKGVIWYLENNSVVDGFHYKGEELSIVYENDDYVEQLLDIAHIDNYRHLEQIISVKFPKCLHVAGKHFDVPHEHLSITEGDIDYNLVFQKYLSDFNGRIILEIDGTDNNIISSKKIINEALRFAKLA